MKITLKEFFESDERLVIHCDTEEKANKLLKEFDKLGKTWWVGESYLEYNDFNEYKDRTCYSNDGFYYDIEYYEDINIKVYSFEDIIFEPDNIEKLPNKPQLTNAERVILENLPKKYKWIARDYDNELSFIEKKPQKDDGLWIGEGVYSGGISLFEHLFQFIKSEDSEPYNIEELLNGE